VDHADHSGDVPPRSELNFFGPFEFWDSHKVEVLNNVDLSDYFWVKLLGVPKPTVPTGAGFVTPIGSYRVA
jgi:hypothetical protein